MAKKRKRQFAAHAPEVALYSMVRGKLYLGELREL
jgi:hypothetical protein